MLSGVIGWIASQLRRLRIPVCGLLLVVYALLPATAWVHEKLEAAAIVADHHDSSAPVQPHDESRCRVCQMIHSCGTHVIFVAPVQIAPHDACDAVIPLNLSESPSIDLIGVHPSRAPPIYR